MMWFRMGPDDHNALLAEAKRSDRLPSQLLLKWMRFALTQTGPDRDFSAAVRLDQIAAAKELLLKSGWSEYLDERVCAEVLLPPGVTPPGPFISDAEAAAPLPTIDARSIEKTLQMGFALFDIPTPDRAPLRKALLHALWQTVPRRMPKKEEREEEPRKQDFG
jgi:hypothetical protein